MEISGWGKFPIINSEVANPLTATDVMQIIAERSQNLIIARGLGRSYGDSALAPGVISTMYMDRFQKFDETTGELTCNAGVSLADILSVFVHKGWFLPVTPGTKFVTVGGAIASDVHGKNHHLEGCFSDYVSSMKIATVSNGIIECSRDHYPELFRATCGGMGLTGVVLEATFKLKPIQSSFINEITIKAKNLQEVLDYFDVHCESTYSVAWIDCLSTGMSLGRSLLMLGEHADSGDLSVGKGGKLGIPVDMPGFLLNRYSIQAFNSLYYHRVTAPRLQRQVHYEPFFYPLDGIHDWNRLYGKRGFTQYQFVIPKEAGREGMTRLMKEITGSKRGSFLAVLKTFGKGNSNYLSFPKEGYTLALDFKLDDGLFDLLNELDSIVLDYGGRIYLAKDVRMSQETFKKSYPNWNSFMDIRKKYGGDKLFHSLQSQRLGL